MKPTPKKHAIQLSKQTLRLLTVKSGVVAGVGNRSRGSSDGTASVQGRTC
jgi:hypothetical protein